MKLALLVPCVWATATLGSAQHEHLRLNAVVSRADGAAAFECWEMATPFQQYLRPARPSPGLRRYPTSPTSSSPLVLMRASTNRRTPCMACCNILRNASYRLTCSGSSLYFLARRTSRFLGARMSYG